MPIIIRLKIDGAKPIRQGSDFFWQTLLAKTKDCRATTFKELDGACDPYQENSLHSFLERLIKAGYVEKLAGKPVTYRVLKRQINCPMVSNDGSLSKLGMRQAQMWNVMRRQKRGFQCADLAIEATTDEIPVTEAHARKYCTILCNAGILTMQQRGKANQGSNIYILKGSANTGPKPPRKISGTAVFDANRGVIVGDVVAREDLA